MMNIVAVVSEDCVLPSDMTCSLKNVVLCLDMCLIRELMALVRPLLHAKRVWTVGTSVCNKRRTC